jgi:hypothetical protein
MRVDTVGDHRIVDGTTTVSLSLSLSPSAWPLPRTETV